MGIIDALGSAIACLLVTCFVGEISYRSYRSFVDVGELEEVPLNQHGMPDLRQYKSAALFLYNTTVAEHHEFLHDVKVANQKHPVTVFQLECANGGRERKSLCSMYGHGQVHEYEEPPVMFFHKGEWSESYHDDIQTKEVPKPEGRRQRVAAIVKWLDVADRRGRAKLDERQEMLDRLRYEEGPSQVYRRKMMEEQAKKAADEKKKDGKKEL